jgi:hypothetical protein
MASLTSLIGPIAVWVAATVADASQPASAPAANYGDPVTVCELADRRIAEASGLVASRRHPGTYYTHNDSGGKPEVYLIDRSGRTRLTIELTSASNSDWEDIAIAPDGDGGFDVCVADIGDNDGKRKQIRIYRFPEPELSAGEGVESTIKIRPREYSLRYDDGPRNAEAFLVDPKSGDGYVIEKSTKGDAGAYRLPSPWPENATVKRAATLHFPKSSAVERLITGATASPDGMRVAARSYVCGWEWRLDNVAGAGFAGIFATEPVRLSLAAEPQGEAIAYTNDGAGLLTLSEKRPAVLYEAKRASEQDASR